LTTFGQYPHVSGGKRAVQKACPPGGEGAVQQGLSIPLAPFVKGGMGGDVTRGVQSATLVRPKATTGRERHWRTFSTAPQ